MLVEEKSRTLLHSLGQPRHRAGPKSSRNEKRESDPISRRLHFPGLLPGRDRPEDATADLPPGNHAIPLAATSPGHKTSSKATIATNRARVCRARILDGVRRSVATTDSPGTRA